MEAEHPTYRVLVHREGKLWVFRIPALDTSGQALDFDQVGFEARTIIETLTAETEARIDVRFGDSRTNSADGRG